VIKALLHKISLEFLQSEEGNRLGVEYLDMQKHPGWKVHESILISVANTISKHMLSEEYTKLQALEKDAQQRGYFISKEIIDFLLDPLKGAKKYAAMAQHNKKMQEATQRRPKGSQGSNRKDKKDG
jgi:hypothetical protein